MKKLIAAVLCLLAVSCASGPVEYSEDKPRTACYRERVGAPFEIVKIVGENPINSDEWMVTFEDRVDPEYRGKSFNLPKSKVGFECVTKVRTGAPTGFRGADESGWKN